MTGCCAFGCANRSEKGFHMFRFPSNRERRKLWENKVRRVGWKPTSSSFLCQEHFDIHQFENERQDGKKKLKTIAVPTIFCYTKPPKVRKSPKKRTSTCTRPTCRTGHKAHLQDHGYSAPPSEDSSTGSYLPKQHVWKVEEVLSERNVCNQERNSTVDQEEPESSLGENFMVSENTIGQNEKEINLQRRRFNITQKLQIKLHRIDLQQQHICEEQEVFTDHLLYNRERNFCLDRKDPECPQIKEAQEKLCISHQHNSKPPQTEEEQEHCISLDQDDLEPPQIKERQERCSSQEGEQLGICPDKEGSKHPDSGSTNNLVLKTTHDRNSSHSSSSSSSMSQIHCDADRKKKTQTCDVCGKFFKSKFKLTTHYRIHTGERPFSCETCGKSFTRRDHMTDHMRTHTGEKPYSCNTCEKSFRYLRSLLSHMRVHTDE